MLLHGHHPSAVYSGTRYGTSTAHAIWLTLIDSIRSVLNFPPTSLLILLPNHAIASQLFQLTKHRFLPQALELTSSLSSFLSNAADDVTVRFDWFSTKWKHLPDRATFSSLTQDAARPNTPPPPPALSHKEEAFRIWASQPLPRRSYPARVSITTPNSNKPPPFYIGALSHKDRRLSSACLQLTNRHCFAANYSLRFRPTAGDVIACPCNFSIGYAASERHLDGPATGGRPMRGRTTADAGDRRNVSFKELQRRYEDPYDDGADLSASAGYGEDGECPGSSDQGGRLVHHTVKHVLLECPLTADLRHKLLRNMSLSEIFGTELGGICLGRFLRASQLLLRPLPPRPDPP